MYRRKKSLGGCRRNFFPSRPVVVFQALPWESNNHLRVPYLAKNAGTSSLDCLDFGLGPRRPTEPRWQFVSVKVFALLWPN